MACIHLVDGDKGGVGKSFVCSTLIQYFIDHKIDFTPVEADRYNPDVANRYGELSLPVRHLQRR
jgi:CO dehydrogenase nickel-insertion accessory protein CooC1